MGINTVLITQARIGSTRLPGKVLIKVDQTPLLKIHLNRLIKSKKVDKIVVATTINPEDDIIENLVDKWGFEVFRGSENDVLDRFYQSVKSIKPNWIVRVTSDCPLIDPKLVDEVISFTQSLDADYGSNTLIENFPDGQDIEVFKFSVLEDAWKNAKLFSEREHVTPFIRKNFTFKRTEKYKLVNFPCKNDFNRIRMTVDEQSDIYTIENLIKNLGYNATWEEYTEFIVNNSREFDNQNIIRNQGYLKSLKKD